MNELATKGRNQTIIIFASVLLVSIYTIVSYHLAFPSVEAGKSFQQIVRFVLTVLIMIFIFKGKEWARTLFTVLFSVAVMIAVVSLFSSLPLAGKIPMLVMSIVYSIAVYHLNFSDSFREYFDYVSTRP
jgi:hypothetical protein